MDKLLKRINLTYLLFIILVLLSAVSRVTNLDVIEFKSDEAINLFLASRPLFGHAFAPGASVSSVGILNPPLFNYILFPILLISLYPPTISFFIGLLNSIAIGLLFLIFKRITNIYISFITCLLMTFSPWLILFSRKIWNQDLLIIFFVPLLYSVYKIKTSKKDYYWLIFIAFSLFLVQIYITSIIFVFLLFIFLLLSKVKINLKHVLIGVIIGLLPMIPYALFEISNNFPNTKALFSINDRLSVDRSYILFLRPLQITNAGDFFYILGNDMVTFAEKFPLVYSLKRIFYLEYLLLPSGAIIFWRNYKNMRFLVITLAALPIIYFLFRFEPLMHYFIVISPLLFLLIGTSFYHLFCLKNKYLKVFSFILFIALIFELIAFNLSFFNILTTQKVLKGDYGTSFIVSENIQEEKLSKYKDLFNYNEILISSFVPKNLMYGFLPIPKMIYKLAECPKNTDILENNLSKNPVDYSSQNELLACHTKEAPDKETLNTLRKKSKINSSFAEIYKNVYNLYLSRNLRKSFWDKEFGLGFEYPEHWQFKPLSTDKILLQSGDYEILFSKNPMIVPLLNNLTCKTTLLHILGNSLARFDCIDGDSWEKGQFEVFNLKGNKYLIEYYNTKGLSNLNDVELKNTFSAVEIITDSIREN